MFMIQKKQYWNIKNTDINTLQLSTFFECILCKSEGNTIENKIICFRLPGHTVTHSSDRIGTSTAFKFPLQTCQQNWQKGEIAPNFLCIIFSVKKSIAY